MTKIVMVWWIITSAGVTEPIEWDGWMSMEECQTALDSFVMPNPRRSSPEPYGIVGKCVEVPK